MRPAVVILLDGASWNVLVPLLEEGRLPNIRELMKKGAYGPLRSVLPVNTIPAWLCYATGKSPGSLRIYDFFTLDMKKKTCRLSPFREKTIWDYVSEHGMRFCVYKFRAPPTISADTRKGCLILDNPYRGVLPRGLKTELEAKFGKFYLEPRYAIEREGTFRNVMKLVDKDFEIMKYLIEKYDPSFAHMGIAYTDGVQHYYWRDMEEGDPIYGDRIAQLWAKIDEHIGLFTDFLESKYGHDFHLFMISDHGFMGADYAFNIGKWLVEKGYLRLSKNALLAKLLLKMPGYNLIHKLIEFYRYRLRVIGDINRPLTDAGLKRLNLSVIDWDRSLVIPLTGELLFINRTLFPSSRKAREFARELADQIRDIITPGGYKLIKFITLGRELYPNDKNAPDIIAYYQRTDVYNAPLMDLLWTKLAEGCWTGTHSLYGVLIAHGPSIRKGKMITGARLIDIAPTVLHLLGLPMPRDIDGRVLDDMLKERKGPAG